VKQRSVFVPQPPIRENRLGSDRRGDAELVCADLGEEICTSSLVEWPVPLFTVALERCKGLGGMQIVVDGQRRRRILHSLRTGFRAGVGRAVPAEVVASERDEAGKPFSIQLGHGGTPFVGLGEIGMRCAAEDTRLGVRPPAHLRRRATP
jgi:hypothetical protein